MKLTTKESTTPKITVLISNSYGINLFINKLEEIIKAVRKGKDPDTVWFICSTQNSSTHKYINYLRHISKKYTWIKSINFFSKPSTKDIESDAHFISNKISLNEIKNLLPIKSSTIYLSGSDEFIQNITKDLQQIGAKDTNINSVFLGQGILEFSHNVNKNDLIPQTSHITFSKSNTSTLWARAHGSLLQTAENIGLTPKFSCRNGSCGRCKVEISQGKICYNKQPEAVPKAGEILLCCSYPASNTENIIINI